MDTPHAITGRPKGSPARRAASMAAAIVIVGATLAGTAGVAHADSQWITLSAPVTELWEDTSVTINATQGADPDQVCIKWWNGNYAWPPLRYQTAVADGWFNGPITTSSIGVGPGTSHFEIRCYQEDIDPSLNSWPLYNEPWDTSVDITVHGGTYWGARLSTTQTDVWENTSFEVDATEPVDTDQLCAVFEDGVNLYQGSWAGLGRLGTWNTPAVPAAFGVNGLDMPDTGTITYDFRCYFTTWTAGDNQTAAYADRYISGVTVTAHATEWASLTANVTDVWPTTRVQIDSTTPTDTDELCATFLDGQLAATWTWADGVADRFWGRSTLAEGTVLIPESGTLDFTMRCYATTMTEWNGIQPTFQDEYVSSVTITGHADSAPSTTTGDTFEPASAAPIATVSAVPSVPFQPAYTNSSFGATYPDGSSEDGMGTDYEVEVGVAEANGADDVTTVTLCLYEAEHVSQCSAADPDPRYAMVLTWTRPAGAAAGSLGGQDGFAKTGDNNYHLGGAVMNSSSGWWDEDAFHTRLRFVFNVSDVMHAGTDWTARATAVNSSSQSGSDEMLTEGVAYFAWVTTPRTPLDYGTLAAGETSEQTAGLGTFIANAASSIFLQGEDFTYSGDRGSATLPLADGPADSAVDPGEVALDCSIGSVYVPGENLGGAIRVTSAPTQVTSDQFGAGTGEAGDSLLQDACRLTYGGGAAISKVQYSALIWVGIGPSEGIPYAGVRPGSDPVYVIR